MPVGPTRGFLATGPGSQGGVQRIDSPVGVARGGPLVRMVARATCVTAAGISWTIRASDVVALPRVTGRDCARRDPDSDRGLEHRRAQSPRRLDPWGGARGAASGVSSARGHSQVITRTSVGGSMTNPRSGWLHPPDRTSRQRTTLLRRRRDGTGGRTSHFPPTDLASFPSSAALVGCRRARSPRERRGRGRPHRSTRLPTPCRGELLREPGRATRSPPPSDP